MRNEQGLPVVKEYRNTFKPPSKAEAKQDIKTDGLAMHQNNFNLTHEKKLEDQISQKAKILHGEFMCSSAFDNNNGPDWHKKSHKDRVAGIAKNAGMKRNTLMNTGDAFITGGNRYDNHLQDFDEMPKLSILNNYRRIKQIMNTNYVKGFSIEQKYQNRTKQDSDQDPEWAKYKEEKQNSMKMSTILRSLNGAKKKKRPLKPSGSEMSSTGMRSNAHSVGLPPGSRNRDIDSAVSGPTIKPLKEAEEGDEVSNV